MMTDVPDDVMNWGFSFLYASDVILVIDDLLSVVL